MSREKRIEEMASIIQSVAERHHGIWCKELAKIIYNAGYRKQSEDVTDINVGNKSEWISVDERLPTVEEQSRGLVGIVNGFNGKIRFENARIFLNYDYNFDEWYSQDYDIQNCKIDYWMPLPEAPKMKGGAE